MYDWNSNVMVKRILLFLAVAIVPVCHGQILPNYGEERAGLSSFTYLKSPVDPWSGDDPFTSMA